MAGTTGRVTNVIVIKGKDEASEEIDKAIKRLQKLEQQTDATGKTSKGTLDRMLRSYNDISTAAKDAAATAKALFDATKEGAAFADMLDVLNAKTGGFEDQLAKASEAAGGLIGQKALVEGAQTFSNFGISLENFSGIAEQVAKTAVATGESTDFLMQSIAKGVARMSPMILDNLGIQVSLTEANKRYADQLGKTVAEMTDAEKKAGLMNEVLRKLGENNQDVALNETRTASLQKLETAYDDAILKLEVLAADSFVEFTESQREGLGMTGMLAQSIRKLAGTDLADLIEKTKEAHPVQKEYFSIMEAGSKFLDDVAQSATDTAVAVDVLNGSMDEFVNLDLNSIDAVAASIAESMRIADAAVRKQERDKAKFDKFVNAGRRKGGGGRLTKEQRALRKQLGTKGAKFLESFAAEAKQRAEAERNSLAVEKTFRDERLALKQAAADEELAIEQALNEALKMEREDALQSELDAEAKKAAAVSALAESSPKLVRQAADLIGASKKEMAFLDGLIATADSIRAFASMDYAGGAQYALAAAAYFKASASSGPGGSKGGGGGGAAAGAGRGGRLSRPIGTGSGLGQGGNITVNLSGFAVGSPQQLGAQLSGALGSVRGTGQERAGRV